MKIAHLTSVHPRHDTRIFLKECCALAEEGHSVTLVVADGKGNDQRDGVSIIDVGKPAGRLNRMLTKVDEVCRTGIEVDADAYHLHDPELLRIAGRLLRSGGGKKVIFDAHEDLPRQILSKPWIPVLLRQLVAKMVELGERCIAYRLNGIIAATPKIAARYSKLNNNTVEVNNYPKPDELAPVTARRSRKRQICYVGGLSNARGIEPLILAMPLIPHLTLVLCGDFSETEFEKTIRTLPGWKQVDYRGQVDRSVVRQVLTESLAGIVTLLPTPAYLDALPVKMFEYMSAGLPVIASDFPLWRKIVEAAESGVCVNPQSPEEIAKGICDLLNNPEMIERMGEAGRKAVLEKYNWPNEARKLIDFYKRFE